MERKPKTIFQLDTPFSEVSWPQINLKDQETILELLVNLLSPIGKHRSIHILPSKGKRSKKRKRGQAKTTTSKIIEPSAPVPELSSHLLVGLASITRHLESQSQASRPTALQMDPEQKPPTEKRNPTTQDEPETSPHLAAVFVSRSSQSPVLNAHLPLLIATATLAHPQSPPTRLVQLPKGCSARLEASLGLPRASFIALFEDAPHSKHLVDFVREHVPVVEVAWLKEAQSALYRPLRVNAIETTFPVSKKGPKKA